MLSSRLYLPLLLAIGGCIAQSQDVTEDFVQESIEKYGKLIARWNRLHPVTPSPLSEEEKALVKELRHSISDPDHIPSIPEINGADAAKLIDGDIIPSPRDIAEIEEMLRDEESGSSTDRSKRAASNLESSTFPIDKPIAFIIEDEFREFQKEMIRSAVRSIEENTCIRFQENGDGLKLEYVTSDKCESAIGDERSLFREHGLNQPIHLGELCFETMGIIQHETIHALGFSHTQKRSDRDDYVDFIVKNMHPKAGNNFEILNPIHFDNHSIPYEYNSVMHYPAVLGSTDGNSPVLIPKDHAYIASVGGQEHGPTFNDWKQINTRYSCFDKCPKNQCANNGYPHPHNCTRCFCPPFHTGDSCDQEVNAVNLIPGEKDAVSLDYENPQWSGGSHGEMGFSTYDKIRQVIKAPKERLIRITLVKIDTRGHGTSCVRECTERAVEIVDGDMSLVGKRFCCANATGHNFVSKTNIVGYQAYTKPGSEFASRVTFALEPLSESPTTDGASISHASPSTVAPEENSTSEPEQKHIEEPQTHPATDNPSTDDSSGVVPGTDNSEGSDETEDDEDDEPSATSTDDPKIEEEEPSTVPDISITA